MVKYKTDSNDTWIFDNKRTTTNISMLLQTPTDGRTLPARMSKMNYRKKKPEIAWDPGRNTWKWMQCNETDGAAYKNESLW